MNARLVQCFFLAAALTAARAEPLQTGAPMRCTVIDVDQHPLSIADGHATVVTIINRANQHDARVVGNHVPRDYYGDPNFRLITVVNLKTPPAFRRMLLSFIRHRLDLEAKRLAGIYKDRGVDRDPRQDLHVVADFDNEVLKQFGVPPDVKKTQVFVFDRGGQLVSRWDRTPSSEDLAEALQKAGAVQ